MSGLPYPVVHRDVAEVIDGRTYPPTTRIHLAESGDLVALDAIASMCAIAEGRITGYDARYLAAMIATVEEKAGFLSRDDMDLDEYIASNSRLFRGDFIGYDEHGGYISARAADPAALASLAGDDVNAVLGPGTAPDMRAERLDSPPEDRTLLLTGAPAGEATPGSEEADIPESPGE